MNEQLLNTAYMLAKRHFKAASMAVFSELDSQFSGAGFDTTHHAAERAMELHLAALAFGRRIWAGSLPYGKAEQALRSQFSEFPEDVVGRALGDAYTETR
jgi:hypothetical protein